MTSMTRRLFLAAGLIVAISGAILLVPSGPGTVKDPDRDLNEMPLVFDSWQGEATELDPRVRGSLGAKVAVGRNYWDGAGTVVSVHTAFFTDYRQGMSHRPSVCYENNGWQLLNEKLLELHDTDQSTVSVSLSTWRQGPSRIMVLYWYQLGEHIIFDFDDLRVARWAMRRSESGPPLIKVLMETSAGYPERAKVRMQQLAQHVYKWINQPGSPTASQ